MPLTPLITKTRYNPYTEKAKGDYALKHTTSRFGDIIGIKFDGTYEIYNSTVDAERKTDCCRSQIARVLNGLLHNTKGVLFRPAKDFILYDENKQPIYDENKNLILDKEKIQNEAVKFSKEYYSTQVIKIYDDGSYMPQIVYSVVYNINYRPSSKILVIPATKVLSQNKEGIYEIDESKVNALYEKWQNTTSQCFSEPHSQQDSQE